MRTDKKITLKIGYKEYNLFFVKEVDGGSSYGTCISPDGGKGIIRVAKGQKRVEKGNTVLHEILHAICWAQGINLEENLEERVVRAVANGLIDFIRENPKVMRQIMDLVKK